MSYDEAFDTMLKVPGVEPKVADCILLYGFNFRQAFPLSLIHILRIKSVFSSKIKMSVVNEGIL